MQHPSRLTQKHTRPHRHTPGVLYSASEIYHCEGVCGRGSSCSSLTHLRMPFFPFIAPAAAAAAVLKAECLFLLFSFPSMTARLFVEAENTFPTSSCSVSIYHFTLKPDFFYYFSIKVPLSYHLAHLLTFFSPFKLTL